MFIGVSGHGFQLPELWLYPLSITVLILFAAALTLWVAAMNVRYRDVGHLLNLALLVWFWATPIVYQGWLVQQKLEGFLILGVDAWFLYLLNPVAVIVLGFQRALYAVVQPEGGGRSGASRHGSVDARRRPPGRPGRVDSAPVPRLALVLPPIR